METTNVGVHDGCRSTFCLRVLLIASVLLELSSSACCSVPKTGTYYLVRANELFNSPAAVLILDASLSATSIGSNLQMEQETGQTSYDEVTMSMTIMALMMTIQKMVMTTKTALR